MSPALRLTVAEYELMVSMGSFDRLDQRVEFIHGELRAMSPAGPVHDEIIQQLLTWAAVLLTGNRCKARSQSGVLVCDSVPEPDLMLLEPNRYGARRPTAAEVLLLVEVADSSLPYDLTEKARLYAAGNIREYWVIDVASRMLVRHLNPALEGYKQVDRFDSTTVIQPAFEGSVSLDLRELFPS